jgi:hypothetical protein
VAALIRNQAYQFDQRAYLGKAVHRGGAVSQAASQLGAGRGPVRSSSVAICGGSSRGWVLVSRPEQSADPKDQGIPGTWTMLMGDQARLRRLEAGVAGLAACFCFRRQRLAMTRLLGADPVPYCSLWSEPRQCALKRRSYGSRQPSN